MHVHMHISPAKITVPFVDLWSAAHSLNLTCFSYKKRMKCFSPKQIGVVTWILFMTFQTDIKLLLPICGPASSLKHMTLSNHCFSNLLLKVITGHTGLGFGGGNSLATGHSVSEVKQWFMAKSATPYDGASHSINICQIHDLSLPI